MEILPPAPVRIKMSLLHALAAGVTILLLIVRHWRALQGMYSEKHCSIRRRRYQPIRNPTKPQILPAIQKCTELVFIGPKYKRDPQIELDEEEIGNYPMV